MALAVAACGDSAAAPIPQTGLLLLDLRTGATVASLSVGSDPVAVLLSTDGATAYVADSTPGDVYAVQLAGRRIRWRSHIGGAPFGLLFGGDRLYVSLFTASAVAELALTNGAVLAWHPVGKGPAVMAADAKGRPLVAELSGRVEGLDGSFMAAGHGYGVMTLDSDVWTCDYKMGMLVRANDGYTYSVPLGLSPFWLAPGAGGTILIAAEGAAEDADAGGVFRLDPGRGTFATLARPRDPDQVIESGGAVYVAAHGDRDVLAIKNGRTSVWARGAAAVALAADPVLGLLVVGVNAHE